MRLKNGWAAGIAALALTATAACDVNDRAADMDAAGTGTPGMEYDIERSDSGITTRVQGQYFGSDVVRGHRVNVDTVDGVVTLTGTVENEQAKQEAVRLAREVEGVARVEDRLTVGAQGGAEQASADTGDDSSPAWITTKIQAQYFVNPEIKPWNIDVTTANDGVVTLSGVVDSQTDREEALRIARGTEGVTTVNDQLRVQGETAATTGATAEQTAERTAGQAERQAEGAARTAENAVERTADAFSDAWITAKIQSKYFLDNDIKGRNINVDTENGVVTVRGTVSSYGERLQAIAMARNTDGVREVQDELRVDTSLEESRTATAGREAGRAAGTAGQQVDDAWITTKLQSRFFIDDQIRPFAVDVDTKNGVVTLNGTVASDQAKQAAEQLARDTDGVTKVVNNLKVDASARQGDDNRPASGGDAPSTPENQTNPPAGAVGTTAR